MSGFSSKEVTSLERTVDLDTEVNVTKSELIEYKYELHRCAQWISDIKAQKICLQFPDALLCDSVNVALNLEKLIEGKVFVLGDTSYGSCCVDEVAAQHVSADAIIHFGNACLSPTKRLPVLHIFEKHAFDIENFVTSFEACFNSDSKVLLLFDVCYSHQIDHLYNKLSPIYSNLVTSRLISHQLPEEKKVNSSKKLGREFNLPEDTHLKDFNVVFIGKDGRTLSNFVMDMEGATFYIYDPDGRRQVQLFEYQKSKFLMRRLYLVERVKDASTIGVVVGTLGVSNYLGAVDRVKRLAKMSGKKSYIIAVGKPNVAKLANFPEIDIFVLIACSENCLLDSKEFYKPIATLYEVELALNPKRELGQTYVTDFRELLPGGSSYSEIEEMTGNIGDLPSDMSLISGKIRHLKPQDESAVIEEPDGSATTMALKGSTALSVSSGGEFLAGRSWRGLEQKLGQTEVGLAVEGRSGIAQGYTTDMAAMRPSEDG